MESIGLVLKQAREHKGITLKEAKQDLHIHGGYLDALESDEFSRIPAPVYVRAFLRQYAHYLDLDPEPLVEAYSSRSGSSDSPSLNVGWTAAPLPESHWGRNLVLVVMGGALAALAGLGYMGSVYQSGKEAAQRSTALPARSQPEPAKQPAGVALPGAGDALASSPTAEASPRDPEAAPGVQLMLTVKEASWVAINGDGSLLYQGRLEAGATRSWTAQRWLSIRGGNAGGIQLSVDGKDLGVPGRSGEVWEKVFRAAPPPAPAPAATPASTTAHADAASAPASTAAPAGGASAPASTAAPAPDASAPAPPR